MAESKKSKAVILFKSLVWSVAFSCIVSIFVFMQWLAWNGPSWVLGHYADNVEALGIGIVLAGVFGILGVFLVAGWFSELFD